MTQNNLRKKYGFDSIDGKIVDQSNLQFDCMFFWDTNKVFS